MSAEPAPAGDVDFGRWLAALIDRWWLPVGGLLLGVVVGAALVVSRGTSYDAYVLIAPGDVYSPSGAPILDYTTSAAGVQALATSGAALRLAAARAGIRESELSGHVTTQPLETGLGKIGGRGTTLYKIDVRLANAQSAAKAADALGAITLKGTTSRYSLQSLTVLDQAIAGYERELSALAPVAAELNRALARKQVAGLTEILVAGQSDAAAVQQDSLFANLAAKRQQLLLARASVLPLQVSGPARAAKVTGLSARNGGSIGGFVGLLAGAIIAIRSRRGRAIVVGA